MWSWRAQMLSAAEARAGNLAFILSEYLTETFAAGDTSLRQLTVYGRRVGGPSAPDAEWAPVLAAARAGLTGVGSISVTDAAGVIRHSTLPALVGQPRGDDYLFRQLSTRTDDALGVDAPFMTVTGSRQFIIPIGRRLVDANGAFEGTVVATFGSAAVRSIFRAVDVGRGGTVWVFHPDGRVLFREPSTADPMGESAAGNPIFAAAVRDVAPPIVEGPVSPGGPFLLSAFHRTAAPPVIVAVSLDRSEVLAEWTHQRILSAVHFATLLVLMSATLTVLFRQMRAKAAAEAELAWTREAESERLREANERLSQALALKDEFLMTVSHELRSPLTSILGWASILQTGALNGAQQRSAIQTIERNAEEQARLVDDLLDVSRVISGKLHLAIGGVDLADVVRHARESITPAADAKRIQIDVDVDPGAAAIAGDAGRLQQVVWNLLSNAIKFTPEGGRVQLRVRDADGHVEIEVKDNGAGIAKDFLPHVFDRFRQADGTSHRSVGGLGLGLAIVRHLVEAHGGTVAADSEGEGRGATFRVRLPRRSASGKMETP